MKLFSLLELSANKAITIQNSRNGSFPAGTNGPHNQVTTAVRNTAHWTYLLLYLFEATRDNCYRDAAERGLTYLMSEDVRPYGYTFLNRNYNNGDKCNGVMGQAWPIETLVYGSEVLGISEYAELAKKIYNMHEFDAKVGLWKRCDVDGSNVRSFDTTLNHQMWFAASAALLGESIKDNDISRCVDIFLDKLLPNSQISEDGRFGMAVNPRAFAKANYWSLAIRTTQAYSIIRKALLFKNGKLDSLAFLIKNLKREVRNNGIDEMEIGYHSFHFYALAILYRSNPGHHFWQTKKFRSALSYLGSGRYIAEVMENTYGIGYNPPGIEIAYSLDTFQNILDKKIKKQLGHTVETLLREQFSKTFDRQAGMMNLVDFDQETYSARLYECVRLNRSMQRLTVI